MPIFGKKKDKPQTGPSEAQSGSPVPDNQNRSPTQAVGGSKDGHSGPGGPYHNSTGSLSGQNQMSGMGMNLGMGHGASGSVGPSGMPGYGGPQQGPPGSQMVQAPHMQQGGPNQGSMGQARGLGMGGPAGSGGPGQLGGSSMAMQPGMMAPGQGSNVPMGPQGPQIGMNGSNGNLMMGSGPSPVGSSASGPAAGQAGMGPAGASTGPPGAASGFKFGAQTRPDGGASAIPGQVARTRKASEDGAGPGISGLPPSSGPNVGPPVGMQGSTEVGGVPTAGPGGSNIGAGASNAPPRPQGSSAVVYPWSQRTLTMNPPRFLDETRQAPAGALSPSPFPRYGHAANAVASAAGDIYLFGGLVKESVKNDLYTVSVDRVVQSPTGPVGATLVQTTGEIPPPRVGHSTILVSNVLIMWGGDTKVRAEDKQDENLYLLNLSTREWTRVRHSPDNPDAGPVGRYGHTVAIVGSRFFVFGGQVDGSFMNDLWAFDLNSLKSTPSWELIRPTGGNLPPRRTGHASVTHKDRIYIFGGTDGQYHYNDTWAYDITTNTWEELSCIGYIPVPREGHATCLVDDVMYIFGGRGVDGRDLGDLASFKISNQRWYMFANMGPSPSGRSGHVLTTYQNKVVVLGGESFAGGKPDDPAIVYVLDTVKIKYPADNKGASTQQGSRKIGSGGAATGVPGQAGAGANQGPVIDPTRAASPPVQDPRRAASPTQGIRPAQPPNGLLTMMQQGAASPEQAVAARAAPRPPGAQPGQIEPPVRAMSPTQQAVRDQRAAALQTGGAPGQPPPSITAVQQQADNLSGPGSSSGHAQGAYNGARSQRSIENLRGQAASPSSVGISARGLNGMHDRNASPAPAPGDAFHYGRGPSPPTQGVNGYNVGGKQSGSAELEALRKREAWMRAALTLAAKKGFVAPEQLELPDGTSAGSRSSELNIEDIDTGVDGSDKQRIVRALVTLKTQLADAKGTISQQAQNEATRLTEADRARQTAMQEAAFYRAKVHAMESSNPTEVSRLERERTTRMEQQLSDALRENAELVRQTNRARDEVVLEKQLRSAAEERLSETAKRAMAAEAAQMRAHEELAALQKRSHLNESTLRDYQERVTTLTSTAARHQADHETSRSQLDDANMALERHVTALTDLQAALAAATSRAAEHERMHTQHRELVEQHEGTLNRLRSELNSKSLETDSHSRRVKELETLLSRHREEAETHRLASTNGLAQVLQFHQQRNATRSTNELAPQMEQKVRALTDEATSLRALHSESKAHAEATATALQDMRDRNIGLEKQHSGLRSELSAMRSQLAIALQEVGRLKDQASSKDVELRERSRAAEEAEVMTSLLKQFMKERGLAVPGDEELSAKSGYADKRIRELEDEIDARTEDAREAQRRLQEAVGKADALERDLASARSASGSAGGADTEALERRAANAERELAEAVASHRERMATLENDYNTAVSFVKGTEKMLRRMKDELTRFKTENATLQTENASLRAGVEPGGEAATEAARDIEALRNRLVDVTAQSEEVAIENRELERRLATLISEQKEAHDRSRDLQDSRADSTRRQNELETEISRLESNLNSVRRELQETHTLNQHLNNELTQASRSGTAPPAGTASIARDLNTAQAANDQLRGENANLAHRLQETEDKLQLLLGRVESNHEGDNVRYSQASISSELDAWEKANNSGAA